MLLVLVFYGDIMQHMGYMNYLCHELVVKYGGKNIVFDDKGVTFADKSFHEVRNSFNQGKHIKVCQMDLINEQEAKFYVNANDLKFIKTKNHTD